MLASKCHRLNVQRGFETAFRLFAFLLFMNSSTEGPNNSASCDFFVVLCASSPIMSSIYT